MFRPCTALLSIFCASFHGLKAPPNVVAGALVDAASGIKAPKLLGAGNDDDTYPGCDKDWCAHKIAEYDVVPFQTWGSMTEGYLQTMFTEKDCDHYGAGGTNTACCDRKWCADKQSAFGVVPGSHWGSMSQGYLQAMCALNPWICGSADRFLVPHRWNTKNCDSGGSSSDSCADAESAAIAPPEAPPAPPPSLPDHLNQTTGCWAPSSGADSEDYTLAMFDGIQNIGYAGDDWFAAVTAGCTACVNSSLLVGGTQTRFDCTVCPSDSVLIVTSIVRQSGWCNAYPKDNCHEQCETCLKGIHENYNADVARLSCTTCDTNTLFSVHKPDQGPDVQRAKRPDGTLIHPVTLGTGTCEKDSTDRLLGYKVDTATGIYDYGAPWCRPDTDWDPEKLICSKVNTVAMRISVPASAGGLCSGPPCGRPGYSNEDELFLAECEIRKLMHRYKCYDNATKCRDGEAGPRCDSTGTSCGGGDYRGESTKTVNCVGFYREERGWTMWMDGLGKRGPSLGCDNIPANVYAFLGCTAGDIGCTKAAVCSRTGAVE